MLHLLWGRAGSGKTTTIVNEICARAAHGEEGLIWLVPEPFSHECERFLAAHGGPAICLHAEVLTFGRLADRVFGQEGGLARRPLSDGGRLLTMRLAVDVVRDQLSLWAKNAHKPAFLASLLQTVDECKCYGIAPEALHQASDAAKGSSALKLRELSLIYASYNALLASGPLDKRDRLTLLADKLRHSFFALDKRLFLDGFVTFTPQEIDVLSAFSQGRGQILCALCGLPDGQDFPVAQRTAAALTRALGDATQTVLTQPRRFSAPALAHLEAHFFDRSTLSVDGGGAVTALCAQTVSDECAVIAQTVQRLAAGGLRYRDMQVAVNDLPLYGPLLERAFEREGVPVFMDSTDDVIGKALPQFLRALADITLYGWRSEDVLVLLRTGLFRAPLEQVDRFEPYLRRWRPHGAQWAKPFTLHPRGYVETMTEEDTRALIFVNRMRALIHTPLSALRGGRTASGWSKLLLQVLLQMRVDRALKRRIEALRSLGELKLADECAQLWELFVEALDECASILGDTPMNLDGFMDLLLLLLSGCQVGTIPVALDRVGIGQCGRLRRHSPRVVFLPGARADAMPMVPNTDSLLSLEERAVLEAFDLQMPPDGEQRLERELFNLYAAMTLPSDALYLSFSRDGDGKALPADVLSRACALCGVEITALPPVVRPFTPPPELREPLSPDAVTSLYGTELRFSATRLQRAFTCRFAYFCQYGLRARPTEQPGFAPLDIGAFIHGMLEQTGRNTELAGGAANVTAEQVRDWAAMYTTAYENTVLKGFAGHTRRFARLFDTLRRSAVSIAADVLAELQASLFSPLAYELRFSDRGGKLPAVRVDGLPGGFSALVEGAVDRVDGWRGPDGTLYLRVVDYKTGKKIFSVSELYHGLGLQLPLYLFTLAKLGAGLFGADRIEPAGMLYVPARDEVLTLKSHPGAQLPGPSAGLKRRGLLLADDAVLEAMSGPDGAGLLPFDRKKSGELDQRSQVGDREDFARLGRHVEALTRAVASDLIRGDVRAVPVRESGQSSACDNCDFAPCCYFDASREKDAPLQSFSLQSFWQALREGDTP